MENKAKYVLGYVKALAYSERPAFLEKILSLDCMREADVIDPVIEYEIDNHVQRYFSNNDDDEILDYYIEWLCSGSEEEILQELLSLRQGEKYEEAISSLFDLPRRKDFNSDEDYLAALPKTEKPSQDNERVGQGIKDVKTGEKHAAKKQVLVNLSFALFLVFSILGVLNKWLELPNIFGGIAIGAFFLAALLAIVGHFME